MAKRDLRPGERLDDFGGYTFYGLIDLVEEARRLNALPAGLAIGAEVIRSLKAGQVITWQDVNLDEDSALVRLRREQDAVTPVQSSTPPVD